LQYFTGDQWPLRGVTGNGTGRKRIWDSREKIFTRVPQKNVLGLQNFLRDKLRMWTNNGSCVEDIWKNFKNIVFESIEGYVPHKILKKKIRILSTTKRK
jgi:hypothetical protein